MDKTTCDPPPSSSGGSVCGSCAGAVWEQQCLPRSPEEESGDGAVGTVAQILAVFWLEKIPADPGIMCWFS